MSLLQVDDLAVSFATRHGSVQALHGIDLAVDRGQVLGIVGESGSGKSVTSLAIMRLLDRAGRITRGTITFDGRDITRAGYADLRRLRGAAISMIFQNPRVALNPIRTVERQIADVLRAHGTTTGLRAHVLELLNAVRIRDPERRLRAYPHELSGGMCQRVMIAMAIACEPALLIADEPTTGLDVTTQQTVMDIAGRDPGAARYGDDPHHPRSRPGRPLVRPDRRHGAGPRRRNRRHRGPLRSPATPLHPTPGRRLANAALDPEHSHTIPSPSRFG